MTTYDTAMTQSQVELATEYTHLTAQRNITILLESKSKSKTILEKFEGIDWVKTYQKAYEAEQTEDPDEFYIGLTQIHTSATQEYARNELIHHHTCMGDSIESFIANYRGFFVNSDGEQINTEAVDNLLLEISPIVKFESDRIRKEFDSKIMKLEERAKEVFKDFKPSGEYY